MSRARLNYFDGMDVIEEHIEFAQEKDIDHRKTSKSDMFFSGILKDGISNFWISYNALTNTLIDVSEGVAWKNGMRISIDTDADYDEDSHAFLVDGVCVPFSSGNTSISLKNYSVGAENNVWIEYLETLDNVFAIHPITGVKEYIQVQDGYKIRVLEGNEWGSGASNKEGITNGIWLGQVTGAGAGVQPTGLTDMPREYLHMITMDAITSLNLDNTQHYKLGSLTVSNAINCHNMTTTDGITCESLHVNQSNTSTMATTTRYYAVSPGDLVPDTDSSDYVIEGVGRYARSGSNTAEAGFCGGVHLPHNAVVTSFKVYWNRTDAVATGQAWLRRCDFVGNYADMAQADSDASTGYHSVEDTTIATATIDNGSYCYNVTIVTDPNDSASEVAFYGAVITFTITEPLP